MMFAKRENCRRKDACAGNILLKLRHADVWLPGLPHSGVRNSWSKRFLTLAWPWQWQWMYEQYTGESSEIVTSPAVTKACLNNTPFFNCNWTVFNLLSTNAKQNKNYHMYFNSWSWLQNLKKNSIQQSFKTFKLLRQVKATLLIQIKCSRDF